MESFNVTTRSRTELVDITSRVSAAVEKSDVTSGLCVVYVPHTTAAVTVNESCDSDVAEDITKTLSKFVPAGAGYAHSEGNSDAHIKAALVGSSAQLIVEERKLQLGRWQGIFFCEFDGPRQRQVIIKILSDNPKGG